MREKICQNCETMFVPTHGNAGLYCCRECYYIGRKKINFQKLIEGDYSVSSRPAIRQNLLLHYGNKCSICEGETWLGNPMPLELDHIDGNAGNNKFENLRLLCPNCHATTPTHKAKNKGFGRASRGLPTY